MSDSTYDLSKVIDAIDSGPSLNGVIGSSVQVSSATSYLAVFNTSRVFVIIQNLGSLLYVKLGTNASPTDYSFKLAPDAHVSIDRWNGVISAARDIGQTGNVFVTEVN